MKLKFENIYKSIKGINEDIELPSLVLLTGLNGAGKTQLLESINNKNIKVLDNGNVVEKIKYINLKNDYIHCSDYSNISNQSDIKKKQVILQKIEEYNLTGNMNSNISISLSHGDNININEIINNIKTASEQLNIPSKDFEYRDLNFWLGNYNEKREPFEMLDLAKLFTTYYESKMKNEFKRFQNNGGLTDSEFVEKYGRDPVELFDELLTHISPNLKINYIKPREYDEVKSVSLINKETGDILNFNDLSTGEKVMFKLLVTIFSNKENLITKPDLILLDEIDSGLHPSLMKKFICYICDVFIKQLGIKVFMTTHSPTTVGLIDDESLFFVSKELPRIRKISKKEAIKNLTSEIPLLNVDYEARRKVFVESKDDEIVYTNIYNCLVQNQLVGEKTPLVFISTGTSTGDITGSSDWVKELCKKFNENGDESVFGIIDWDLKNNSKDHVFVLSNGKKYSIENCILDPLLVGMFLVRMGYGQKYDINIKLNDLYNMNNNECQSIVNVVLSYFGYNLNNCIENEYCNNYELNIPTEFFKEQGHSLEDKYKSLFPELKKYNKLIFKIVNDVIIDFPKFCPKDFQNLFCDIISN